MRLGWKLGHLNPQRRGPVGAGANGPDPPVAAPSPPGLGVGNTSKGSGVAQLGDDESQLRYLSPEEFFPSALVSARVGVYQGREAQVTARRCELQKTGLINSYCS